MTDEEKRLESIRQRAMEDPAAMPADVIFLLGRVTRLQTELEREREDRTREYEFAGADAETAAKRIRGLIAENETLRADLDKTLKVAVRNASDAQRRVGELAKQDQRTAALEAENTDIKSRIETVVDELTHMRDALDIDMPSDAGYLEQIASIIATLKGS